MVNRFKRNPNFYHAHGIMALLNQPSPICGLLEPEAEEVGLNNDWQEMRSLCILNDEKQ